MKISRLQPLCLLLALRELQALAPSRSPAMGSKGTEVVRSENRSSLRNEGRERGVDFFAQRLKKKKSCENLSSSASSSLARHDTPGVERRRTNDEEKGTTLSNPTPPFLSLRSLSFLQKGPRSGPSRSLEGSRSVSVPFRGPLWARDSVALNETTTTTSSTKHQKNLSRKLLLREMSLVGTTTPLCCVCFETLGAKGGPATLPCGEQRGEKREH